MLIALAMTFTLTQPSSFNGDCRADSLAVKAIRDVAQGIIAADNARDIARVIDSYASDAWLMPPNESPVQGHAGIKPRYEALFSGFDPAIAGRIDEACASGSIGFVRGHNGGRMISRTGGAPRMLNDAYLMTLRLGPDGRWRISHLIWHPQK
jgi:ketosteroid isomerase-like protein